MKNQNPFKYGPPRRVIDRKQNIFNLIVRLEDKHHVTAREIKFALGTALWNDFKREEIASCPEKLSPVINRQLAKYSRALYRADRLHARWKQVQQRAFMIYRGKKLPVSVAKALYCREVCKQYEIALENLRDLLAKNHILSHYFDLPVLGLVFDDIAHEYESMPRFWDTLPQMNREIQSRFRKSYLKSLYNELFENAHEHIPPDQSSHFELSVLTRFNDHPLDENWSFGHLEQDTQIRFASHN
jgi:hypothetical protein